MTTYSASFVSDALGIPRTTVAVWVHRGKLDFPKGEGRGKALRLTLRDAVRMAALYEMTVGSRLELSYAAQRLEKMEHALCAALDGDEGRIVVTGDGVFQSMFHMGRLVKRVREALETPHE